MFGHAITTPFARLWSGGAARELAPAIGPTISDQLRHSIPLFGGGGISTVALALSLALQIGTWPLAVWATAELLLATARFGLTWRGRSGPSSEAAVVRRWLLVVEVLGSVSVGLGSVAAASIGGTTGVVLAWMTAVAFAGENCVRNLGDVRLMPATVMTGSAPVILMLGFSGRPVLMAAAGLTGLFIARMLYAASRLNGLLTDAVRAERESDHRARHDKLTGLLNRAGLERELELMRRDNPRANLTLFYIDLDRFKSVNDLAGHSTGDLVLRGVAEGLLALTGSGDAVSRIGGDEFIVITALDHLDPAEFGAALQVAICGAGRHRHPLDTVTASIGVAQTSINGDNLPQLLEVADARLYAAKRAGGARCVTD